MPTEPRAGVAKDILFYNSLDNFGLILIAVAIKRKKNRLYAALIALVSRFWRFIFTFLPHYRDYAINCLT